MGFLRLCFRVFAVLVVFVCSVSSTMLEAKGGDVLSGGEAVELTAQQLLMRLPEDRYLGNEDAPVVMVEYASFSCAHCADFITKVFPRIKKEYIDTGRLLYIYRDFPLDRLSLSAAMLGSCYKDNAAFFSYVRAVFGSYDTLIATYKDLGLLVNIAKISNISDEDFKRCTTDEELMDRVVQQKFLAVNTLDVNATPSFFINGERYSGGHDFDSIAAEIDRVTALQLHK
ncbi:Disulfide bond formation protein D precursor [Anaplasma phagocytophilum]|nr:Disulfide bond formation protein D precursor [Anaplasma phagocytophilum]SCV66397.1 Disulfide bond formation protein D precursor [Anaplasma phagocytophilum]